MPTVCLLCHEFIDEFVNLKLLPVILLNVYAETMFSPLTGRDGSNKSKHRKKKVLCFGLLDNMKNLHLQIVAST